MPAVGDLDRLRRSLARAVQRWSGISELSECPDSRLRRVLQSVRWLAFLCARADIPGGRWNLPRAGQGEGSSQVCNWEAKRAMGPVALNIGMRTYCHGPSCCDQAHAEKGAVLSRYFEVDSWAAAR
jgi:hypothetical protein